MNGKKYITRIIEVYHFPRRRIYSFSFESKIFEGKRVYRYFTLIFIRFVLSTDTPDQILFEKEKSSFLKHVF